MQSLTPAPRTSVVAAPLLRAAALGLVLVVVMGWVTPIVTFFVRPEGWSVNGIFSWGQIPAGPFLVLVILARGLVPALNAVLRRRLGPDDALMPYAMVLATLSFCSLGIAYFVPGLTAVPFYASGGHPTWAKEVLPHVPDWLLLSDVAGRERIARYLYEGDPAGMPVVPWEAWTRPLAGWLSLLMVYYCCAFCLTGLFRRVWFRQEHITFPLAEFALAVGGGASAWGTRRGLFRERLLWIGFVIPFIHALLVALSIAVPGVPRLAFHDIPISDKFDGMPWRILSGMTAEYYPALFIRMQWLSPALGYLIPSQIVMGVVGFFWLRMAYMVVLGSFGAVGGQWDPYLMARNHSTGGMIVFAAFLFYSARRELARMWAQVRDEVAGNSVTDPHPDRWMLAGFIVSAGALVAWTCLAGVSTWLAVAFVGAILAMQACEARMVAVLGLQHATTYITPASLLDATIGSRRIGARNVPMTVLLERVLWYHEQHTFFPMVLQGHKIGDVQGWQDRRYVPPMLAAGAVALVAYTVYFLRMSYQHGGLMVSSTWFYMNHDLATYRGAASRMSNLTDASAVARGCVLVGAAMMWGLMAAHRAYAWWPLHPLGFLLGAGYTSKVVWFGLTVGWAIKASVSRYASERAYYNLRPLFVGLLFGDVAGQAFSSVFVGMLMTVGVI